jgi:hypothetical protein
MPMKPIPAIPILTIALYPDSHEEGDRRLARLYG